tara:strand:- start:373 stop:984 length:612 start_codon:yes stop_codon:yes gene_type:complete
MSTKQQIQNIKTDIERTVQGLRTKPQEFTYKQTKGFVKPNTLYSIYYGLNKKENYLTGISDTSNSKIINRVKNNTLYSTYSDIKPLNRQSYPKTTPANPSESDYRIGTITRYFTKKTNEVNAKVFEITEDDFNNQNNLYDYTSFQWRISGKKDEVNRDNSATLRNVQSEFPNITKTVFPLQLWIPPKNSPDDVQNKLNRLKKN